MADPGQDQRPVLPRSKLGAEAVAGLKKLLGYDPEESFHVDEEALAHARKVAERGLEAHKEWDEKYNAWRKANPDKAALYDRIKPASFRKASTRPSTTSRPPSKSARTSPPVALPAPL